MMEQRKAVTKKPSVDSILKFETLLDCPL